MKKIVVTGAAGFIGSHLVRSLLASPNNRVVGLDNLQPAYGQPWSELRLKTLQSSPNFEFIKLDLIDVKPNILADIFCESHSVIHLAAWPGVRTSQILPHEYSKANLTGFGNVLEAIRIANPRQFLFASSSSIYGDLGSEAPVEESDATGKNLKSYYAATKWANEILAQSHSSISQIPTAALRFFTVYGEGGRPDMAYWTFLENIIQDKPINLYGRTGGSRNFTYIADAIEIIKRIIDLDISNFSAINVAAGESVETIQFVQTLANITGRKLQANIVQRPDVDVEKTSANLMKLTSLIGSVDQTPIEIGLKNFHDWFIENGLE